MAKDFGLVDGFSFGLPFEDGRQGSIFTCEGKGLTNHARHCLVIHHLMPHLHQARANLASTATDKIQLTAREREILIWISRGCTDDDMALHLCISSRTIKFHAENALRKLGAKSRAHAVAIALASRLIPIVEP